MPDRSYLFVPGDRPDRFEKALISGADTVIIDLEDAVASGNKTEARETVAAWLSSERPVYVRVNGPDTRYFEPDLKAIARPGLSGVVLPKAENPDGIAEAASRVPEEVGVLPLLETALGVWNARDLAEVPCVERLAFGDIDFRLDTGIEGESEELLYARSRLVLASRVAGIPSPLDGVTTALDDPGRLAEDVSRARRLGFGGKLCIHPKQVETINRGFMPSETQIAQAKQVLNTAEASGTGAARLEGEMIDRPVIERAQAILKRADQWSTDASAR